MKAASSIKAKLAGFLENLSFSNCWSVMMQRLFHRSHPLVTYLWKKRWWCVCDARRQDANAAKEVLAGGCYDAFILRSARDGGLSYVNVGAHIGTFDIAVASTVGEIPYAVSVEMNPSTFARLNFNLDVNRLLQVRTLNAGIGGENGTARVRTSDCSLADSLYATASGQPGDKDGFIVPIWTLANAIGEAGVAEREFDLLKLDCEGAEYAIVEESSPTVLRRFAHVVMELHPPVTPGDMERLWRKMESCGFTATEAQPRGFEGGVLRFWTRNSS